MARRGGGTRRPKRAHPVIDRLVDAGAPVQVCCRLLGVSRQGYYRYLKRPTSSTQLRRLWLTGLIREIHIASRGTYGYRRIHAELTIGMEIPCSSRLVSVLMTKAGIVGLPGPTRVKRLKGVATADDLVNQVPSPQPERTLGHRHHGTSHKGRKSFLRGSSRCLQPKNRRLGY